MNLPKLKAQVCLYLSSLNQEIFSLTAVPLCGAASSASLWMKASSAGLTRLLRRGVS